jgi:DNA-binding response OmpR family regulator
MEPKERLQVPNNLAGICRRATGAHMQERSSNLDRGAVRVLVVDDDQDVRDVILSALEREHFEIRQAADGTSAIDLAQTFEPDVILLDLNLPDLSGIDVCQRVRAFSDPYILMLTASDDLSDKLVGLSAGADDYVIKPCSMPEVIARIRALMRRTREASTTDGVRAFGDLRVDPASREVSVRGKPVTLTRIEFDLLDVLSTDPKAVVSRVRLLERVWGPNWYGDDHIVDVHMSNLRRKIGPRFVRTVRGVGFRLGDAA